MPDKVQNPPDRKLYTFIVYIPAPNTWTFNATPGTSNINANAGVTNINTDFNSSSMNVTATGSTVNFNSAAQHMGTLTAGAGGVARVTHTNSSPPRRPKSSSPTPLPAPADRST